MIDNHSSLLGRYNIWFTCTYCVLMDKLLLHFIYSSCQCHAAGQKMALKEKGIERNTNLI
jgi:hypothetical protein